MNKQYQIEGGGGARLWAGEWGSPAGPTILFIHGFMQCHLSWQAQLESDLAKEFRMIAIDNRGHGQSDKPHDPMAYQDGKNWADDIAAVIKETELQRPVLVGWSNGGLIMLDYCQRYGCDDISGINFVAAAVRRLQDAGTPPPTIPQARADLLSGDLLTRISGTRAFLHACTAKPVDQDTFETWLAFNMLVPRHVRAAMFDRELDFDPVLDALSVPALVSYCMADALVLPFMGEHAMAHIPNATASIYGDAGHSPFHEETERFNKELVEFVRIANKVRS